MKFTDRALRASQCPADKPRAVLRDEATPGLSIHVTAKAKRFSYAWTFEGKRKTTALGEYPAVSLAEARDRIHEIKKGIAAGVDITAKKTDAETVQDAFEEYDRHHLSSLRHTHERQQVIRRELSKLWLSPIANVTRADLERILRKKRAEGKAANRVRSYLKAFFAWVATETMMLDGVPNPAAILTRPVKEFPRDRVLSLDEIRQIYKAAGEAGLPAVQLLILTGARRSEIAELTWQELNISERRIELSGDRTKNGKPHLIHLSDAALFIIQAQPQGEKYVLTKRVLNRVMQVLPVLEEPWRLHDFRRTFATAMSERGSSVEVLELCLGHSLSRAFGSIAAVYNRAERLPDRARALDTWAGLVTGVESSVVKLHAG